MKAIWMMAVWGAVLFSGCATVDLPWEKLPWGDLAEIAIEEWERAQIEEEPEPATPPPVVDGIDPNNWRTWPNAPKELVPGVKYAQGKGGRFEYRTSAGVLYKPSSDLLLLGKDPTTGKHILPQHIGRAGEFSDRECTHLVKWFRWPESKPPEATDKKLMDGKTVIPPGGGKQYTHAGDAKIRDAKAKHSGSWFAVWHLDGHLMVLFQIVDREAIQR